MLAGLPAFSVLEAENFAVLPFRDESGCRAQYQPKLQRLHSYWQSKRRADRLPAFRDIRPEEIPNLLASLLIWDVRREGREFVVRLAGTTIEEAFGRSMHGLTLAEVMRSPSLRVAADRMARVVQEARPDYSAYDVCPPRGPCLAIDRVMLPLASNGGSIDGLLSGMIFTVQENCSAVCSRTCCPSP